MTNRNWGKQNAKIPTKSQGKKFNEILIPNYDSTGKFESKKMEEADNIVDFDEKMDRKERELATREAQVQKEIDAAEQELEKRRRAWRKRRYQLRLVRLAAKEAWLARLKQQLGKTTEFANKTAEEEEMLTPPPNLEWVRTSEATEGDRTNTDIDGETSNIVGAERQQVSTELAVAEQETTEDANDINDLVREDERPTQEPVKDPKGWHWRKKDAGGRFVPKVEKKNNPTEKVLTPRTKMLTQDRRISIEIRKLYMKKLKRGGPGPNQTPRKASKEIERSSSSRGSGTNVQGPSEQWWQRPGLISTSSSEDDEGDTRNNRNGANGSNAASCGNIGPNNLTEETPFGAMLTQHASGGSIP